MQGRYSVVGAQPTIEIVATENMVTIMDHEEGRRTEEIMDDPTTVPRRIMEGLRSQLVDGLPEAFCGKRRGLN
jgi:anthranilate synthase component 1